MAFNNWPYTNFQDLNLGWILGTYKTALNKALEALGKANAVEATVGTYTDSINAATLTANQASATANQAMDIARNANEVLFISADAENKAVNYVTWSQGGTGYVTASDIYSAIVTDHKVPVFMDRSQYIYEMAGYETDPNSPLTITRFKFTKNGGNREDIVWIDGTGSITYTTSYSGGGTLVVNITRSSGSGTTTSDTTYAAIESAYENGMTVQCHVVDELNGLVYYAYDCFFTENNDTGDYFGWYSPFDYTNSRFYRAFVREDGLAGISNIPVSGGGGTVSGAVLYDSVQNLTAAQKAQARDNIGADSRPLILNVTYSGNDVYTVDKTAAEIRANMHNLLLTFGLNEGVTIDSYQIYGSPPKHYIVFSVADPDTSRVTYIEYTVSVYFAGFAPSEADDVPTVTHRVIQHNIGGGELPDATDASVGDYLKLDSNKNAVWDELPLFAPPIVDTATGNLASITDGANNYPIKSLIANIDPVQSGSGDPSPSNVRPITGFTGCKVTRTGKNLYNLDDQIRTATNTYITPELLPNTNYVFSTDNQINGLYASYSDDETMPSISSNTEWTNIANNYNSTALSFNSGTHKWYKLMTFETNGVQDRTYQLELGTVATAYQPYQGDTYNITFPAGAGTVYGGTLDMTNGVLTVTKGFIPSYNGETLPGEWISSMDVYTQGGTPTTGAQVCYDLATPVTYQLDPVTVKTLLGVNNIQANTGNVSVEYYADTKLYIQKLVATNSNNRTSVTEVKEKPEIVLKETESEEKSEETPDEEITEETEP